jgi:hypothetical protein
LKSWSRPNRPSSEGKTKSGEKSLLPREDSYRFEGGSSFLSKSEKELIRVGTRESWPDIRLPLGTVAELIDSDRREA